MEIGCANWLRLDNDQLKLKSSCEVITGLIKFDLNQHTIEALYYIINHMFMTTMRYLAMRHYVIEDGEVHEFDEVMEKLLKVFANVYPPSCSIMIKGMGHAIRKFQTISTDDLRWFYQFSNHLSIFTGVVNNVCTLVSLRSGRDERGGERDDERDDERDERGGERDDERDERGGERDDERDERGGENGERGDERGGENGERGGERGDERGDERGGERDDERGGENGERGDERGGERGGEKIRHKRKRGYELIQSMRKTQMCKYWRNGKCRNIDCAFAHGFEELRYL